MSLSYNNRKQTAVRKWAENNSLPLYKEEKKERAQSWGRRPRSGPGFQEVHVSHHLQALPEQGLLITGSDKCAMACLFNTYLSNPFLPSALPGAWRRCHHWERWQERLRMKLVRSFQLEVATIVSFKAHWWNCSDNTFMDIANHRDRET